MKFEIHRIVIGPKSKQISQIPIKTVLIILSLIIVCCCWPHSIKSIDLYIIVHEVDIEEELSLDTV